MYNVYKKSFDWIWINTFDTYCAAFNYTYNESKNTKDTDFMIKNMETNNVECMLNNGLSKVEKETLKNYI